MNLLSDFATGLTSETAFEVLAVARRLKAAGKDVIELQIGDSPFPSSSSAIRAGKEAIDAGLTHYCPSPGIPEFREGIAENYRREFGVAIQAENVIVGCGAKVFEQYFCEAFVDPGDAVLLFSPQFPTFEPNVKRRGARPVFSPLRQSNQFRPDLNDVERFIRTEPKAKAIFLNSPHNPTGGVATREDLKHVADLIRGRPIALFSDEPYCHMVWKGEHRTILAEPGMLDQCLAAYTFSKSYSMSGWRLGYAVGCKSAIECLSKLVNTTISCVPPMIQKAGLAALQNDALERNDAMNRFRRKVESLVEELRAVPEIEVLMPAGTFYVFPNVHRICERLGIRSHGLAMYLLEGADDQLGVGCLGGECFGAAGQGYLRFSCAESDDRIRAAVAFLKVAIQRSDRVIRFLDANPKYRLPY
jgi:aspartate aminotransferase